MSRWTIEKSGTGIEKSGTGIEKSGTGIEKSGTGIEKSGTGIEKSGTGIGSIGRTFGSSLLVVASMMLTFASHASAGLSEGPTGTLQIVVSDDRLAVSWIIDGSVFSGVAAFQGSFTSIPLTEVRIAQPAFSEPEVVGGGTGKNVVGGGTGKDVVGGGTGANVVGGGTGANVVGGGTGANVVGGGTGANVVGGGTGANVVGGGTGSDAIVITLPSGTEMQMEVSLGCNVATVSVMDANFAEVVSFSNVPVIGASSFCTGREPSYGRFREIAYAIPIGDSR